VTAPLFAIEAALARIPALPAFPALLAEASAAPERRWLSAPPAWAAFLFALAILAFTVAAYRLERTKTSRAWRLLLAGLRAGAFAVVILALSEPVDVTTRGVVVRDSTVAVLVDESLSMSLKDRYPPEELERIAAATGLTAEEIEESSRLDLVKRVLAGPGVDAEVSLGSTGGRPVPPGLVARLLEQNHVKVYAFSKQAAGIGEARQGAAAPPAAKPGDPGAGAGVGPGPGPGAEAARDPRAVLRERVADLEPTGTVTAIGDSLSHVINETRGLRLAGIILLTDGRSNSDVTSPVLVAQRLRGRGVPLFCVGVGDPHEPRDVAVTDHQVAELAIAGEELPIKVALSSQGFESAPGGAPRVEVKVTLDGREMAPEDPTKAAVDLEGGGARQEVQFTIRPETPGEYTLEISVPEQEGEVVLDNNRSRPQRLRVLDKKIKVLYIEGYPRWEYRYLKNGLIRDPKMEAHCFLLSADPEFPQEVSPGLDALVHVPWTKEDIEYAGRKVPGLFSFHVIILGDVDPRSLRIGPTGADIGDERLRLLREFVETHGGGLLLLAGERFNPRAYSGTPIEALLPIVIDRSEDDGAIPGRRAPRKDPFRLELTVDGRRAAASGVLQLENDARASLELWEAKGVDYAAGLPGFYWYYRAKDRKRHAEVLAVHPHVQTAKGEKVPIFTILPAGAGNVFFSAIDETWRWRAGVGDRYFYRFWAQTLRYLSTGRLLRSKRFLITTDKPTYDLGEKIRIIAEVQDEKLKPSESKQQPVFLRGPDGRIDTIQLTPPPDGAPGRYEATVPADRIGSYRAWISASATAVDPGTGGPGSGAPPGGAGGAGADGDELAVRPFQVQFPVLEKSDPKMDEELLTRLSVEETGGRYFPLSQVAELPAAVGRMKEVTEEYESARRLWSQWWVAIAFVLLLTFEWILRRWQRMV